MQKQETAQTTHTAFDALEIIHDFLEAQVAEAQAYFKAQTFGTAEWNEEQAFLKALLKAQAIYRNIEINGGNHGMDLLMLKTRIDMEYRKAIHEIAMMLDTDRALDEMADRSDKAVCAAWGMVYHFVNQQYRRTNAA